LEQLRAYEIFLFGGEPTLTVEEVYPEGAINLSGRKDEE
jgi:hypothetical protein